MAYIIFENDNVMVYKTKEGLKLDTSDGSYWFQTELEEKDLIKLANAILAAV